MKMADDYTRSVTDSLQDSVEHYRRELADAQREIRELQHALSDSQDRALSAEIEVERLREQVQNLRNAVHQDTVAQDMLFAEVERLREALSVLPPYLKAANAGDTGAIPLALDMISAALSDQRQP